MYFSVLSLRTMFYTKIILIDFIFIIFKNLETKINKKDKLLNILILLLQYDLKIST